MITSDKKQVELLAPAGDFESLKAAINNGANAVYLGIDTFNARSNIQNFNMSNLHDAVNYAHLFGVKIYLALNILIKDEEFNQVFELVEKALQFNVDAFIIQDIGVAYYLKQKFPYIELHASTQMGFNNLEGALFAKKVGFKRVVLARETPLEEIKRIKENCDIELEYFVQGALCVAYSGNCYLCSLLANSSGNRGKCKQFCRLQYTIKNDNLTKKGYLLSTKDFCMIPKLEDLIEAGIYSLKIEGRARRPAYVAQSVKTYREILDNNFNFTEKNFTDLKKVYNRGDYSCGYLVNNSIIYSKCQNHIGVEIGEVINFHKGKKFNEIFIKTNYLLKKDDVVKFFKNEVEQGIISINDISKLEKDIYRITTTNIIEKNCKVRLIVDSENERKVLSNYKKINVEINFYAKEGEKAKLVLKTENGYAEQTSNFLVEKAKSSPLTEFECKTQLTKLGEMFYCNNFSCEVEDVFMAKSQLNQMRRLALEKLEQNILDNYNKQNKIYQKQIKTDKKISLTNLQISPQRALLSDSFENLIKNQDKKQIKILQPSNYGYEWFKKYYDKYYDYNIFISFPIITNSEEVLLIKKILTYCKNWGIYANNYYVFTLTDPNKIMVGSNMNIYNSYSVMFYKNLGIKNIVLSIENIENNLIKNNGTNLFAFEKFYPEYMYFKHCPLKEHFASKCNSCLYKNNLDCKLNNREFKLLRRRFLQCHFVLKNKTRILIDVPDNLSSIEEITDF